MDSPALAQTYTLLQMGQQCETNIHLIKRNEIIATNRAGTPHRRIAVTRFTERTTQKTKYKITEL